MTRQIHIACGGRVVSTRLFPDPITEDEIVQIHDAVMADACKMREHGRVVIWVNEGVVAHLMGGLPELPAREVTHG